MESQHPQSEDYEESKPDDYSSDEGDSNSVEAEEEYQDNSWHSPEPDRGLGTFYEVRDREDLPDPPEN